MRVLERTKELTYISFGFTTKIIYRFPVINDLLSTV